MKTNRNAPLSLIDLGQRLLQPETKPSQAQSTTSISPAMPQALGPNLDALQQIGKALTAPLLGGGEATNSSSQGPVPHNQFLQGLQSVASSLTRAALPGLQGQGVLPGTQGESLGAAGGEQAGPLSSGQGGTTIPFLQGKLNKQWDKSVQTQGSFDRGGIQGQGQASAGVQAGADAQGQVGFDPQRGLVAEGQAQAGAMAQAQAQGQIGNELFQAQGQANAQAGVDANASGSVQLNPQDGLKAQGQANVFAGAKGAASGQVNTDLFRAQGQVNGQVGVDANANGSVQLNARDGLKAQGQVGVEAGGKASAAGQFQSSAVNVDAQADVSALVSAKAKGDVTANLKDGLRIRGDAMAKAEVEAKATGHFETAGVNVGGHKVDVNGDVKAFARAGARAGVDADVVASVVPPRAGVDAEAGAFAGAKAGVEGKIGLGPFVSAKGSAEAWAGAGAQAGVTAKFDNGKIKLGIHGGAAAKLGFGLKGSVEIDVKKMAESTVGGALQLAERGLEFAVNPVGAVTHAAEDVLGLLTQKDASKALELGSDRSPIPLSRLMPSELTNKVEQGYRQGIDQLFAQTKPHLKSAQRKLAA